jgi:hypothetical protein
VRESPRRSPSVSRLRHSGNRSLLARLHGLGAKLKRNKVDEVELLRGPRAKNVRSLPRVPLRTESERLEKVLLKAFRAAVTRSNGRRARIPVFPKLEFGNRGTMHLIGAVG